MTKNRKHEGDLVNEIKRGGTSTIKSRRRDGYGQEARGFVGTRAKQTMEVFEGRHAGGFDREAGRHSAADGLVPAEAIVELFQIGTGGRNKMSILNGSKMSPKRSCADAMPQS